MRKLFTSIFLAASLSACAAGYPTTRVEGTGELGPGLWQLQVENSNWLTAKIYLVPQYGDRGPRIATAAGLGSTVKTFRLMSDTFRIRVEFLASDAVWISDIWSWGTDERCVSLRVMNYVPATYLTPCPL